MRRIRVWWARVLVVLLAAAVAVLSKRNAEQARRIDELELRVAAELRFLAEQDRVKTTLKEVNEARLLLDGCDHSHEVDYFARWWHAPAVDQTVCLGRPYGQWRVTDQASTDDEIRVELRKIR
jgi:hypothetical protein